MRALRDDVAFLSAVPIRHEVVVRGALEGFPCLGEGTFVCLDQLGSGSKYGRARVFIAGCNIELIKVDHHIDPARHSRHEGGESPRAPWIFDAV